MSPGGVPNHRRRRRRLAHRVDDHPLVPPDQRGAGVPPGLHIRQGADARTGRCATRTLRHALLRHCCGRCGGRSQPIGEKLASGRPWRLRARSHTHLRAALRKLNRLRIYKRRRRASRILIPLPASHRSPRRTGAHRQGAGAHRRRVAPSLHARAAEEEGRRRCVKEGAAVWKNTPRFV